MQHIQAACPNRRGVSPTEAGGETKSHGPIHIHPDQASGLKILLQVCPGGAGDAGIELSAKDSKLQRIADFKFMERSERQRNLERRESRFGPVGIGIRETAGNEKAAVGVDHPGV